MAAVYHKIIQYIDTHVKDEITITEIANIAGYSPNYIYKLFKQYSPYSVMEYVRRKKLYSAAGEIYKGRKLYDIALDYGYETPAGFYKAFKSVIGFSPSEYKNNIMKEGIAMFIENVEDIEELELVLSFLNSIHNGQPVSTADPESDEKFGMKWWVKQLDKHPELLLYAKGCDGGNICAVTLGFEDAGSVTVHEGVAAEYINTGIFESLFVELENRAKKSGFSGVVLGIGEGEEDFYAKLGYIGKTLVQSEKYSIDELKVFNEQYNNYEVAGTNIYEGTINQMWIKTSLLDKKLKQKYEKEIGNCWVQVIVHKSL